MSLSVQELSHSKYRALSGNKDWVGQRVPWSNASISCFSLKRTAYRIFHISSA